MVHPEPLLTTPSMRHSQPPRGGWLRRIRRTLATLVVVLSLVVAGALVWFAIGDAAEVDDVAFAIATHDIAVSDNGEVLTIAPLTGGSEVAVAFLPGTRVQRDAYLPTWAPIVAATGVTVHIAAVPLNLPILAGDPIGDIIAAHPGTTSWVVGGHSMGGFEAASYVGVGNVDPAGLLLWGSGPAKNDLTTSTVPTLLVAGGADAVLPLDFALREGRLPTDATIEVIDGMVHGQFGRYSETESVDDTTRRSDADTLADLVDVTTGFLDQVDRDVVAASD